MTFLETLTCGLTPRLQTTQGNEEKIHERLLSKEP
jgi:hypothetical protein